MHQGELNDRRERQCRQGKIVAGDAQREVPEHEADGADAKRKQRYPRPQGQAIARCKNGGAVAAKADKGRLRQRDLTGQPGDNHQPQDDDGGSGDQAQLEELVLGKQMGHAQEDHAPSDSSDGFAQHGRLDFSGHKPAQQPLRADQDHGDQDAVADHVLERA
jgi:hypothetical protein